MECKAHVEFHEVVESLQSDLDQVEERLRKAAEVDYPLVGDFLRALIGAGGKRLRPVLLLLASKPFEYHLDTLVPAAAGVEMLHTASLIHDDTIDKALLRRGQPTLNSQFSNETVILLGDYLFAQSAILATETMNPRVVAVFASALGDICDGQLMEIFSAHRLDQTNQDYEQRIYGKTAALFAGAAEMGAIIGQAPEEQIRNLRQFGSDVGMAFQIVDDVLDFRATSDETGKPVGADLRQGTVTLPLMLFLRNADGNASADRVQNIVDGSDVPDAEVAAVTTLIRESGAIEESLETAQAYVDSALSLLDELPDPTVAQQLATLARLALYRDA